jgi:GT2 family glycosyltransferase
MDARIVLLRGAGPKIRGEHVHVVPARMQVSHRGAPHELVAAEVVRRVHVPRCEDAHRPRIESARMDRPAPIAAAVVSWNTRELLDRCLRSLEPEARSGRLEAWVVDNASTDGSADLVRERHGWARLAASPDNLGFGAAVNLVADRTESEWLLVANADVALRSGALDALLEAARRDPRAGALAPRLVLPDGSTQHSVFAFPTIPFAFILNSGLFHLSRDLSDRLALLDRWDHTRSRRVPWAVGACLLVRRAAWDDAGGFDTEQWMYAEDLDLGWKLRRAGWATRYEPRAVVDHESAAATRQAFGDDEGIAARWQRSTYGWIARRRGAGRARLVAALNFAGSGLRYLVLTPAALVAPRRWRERRRALGRWTLVHAAALGRRATLEGLR